MPARSPLWRSTHATRYKRLPRLIRLLREGTGLTHRDLAQKPEMAQVSIHKYETGHRRVDVGEFCDTARVCKPDVHATLNQFLGRRK